MSRTYSPQIVPKESWKMDSKAIGQFVLPFMEKLPLRITNLQAALLCTSDGFNVCSIGVTQAQIGKLSALTSSLMSIGQATMNSLLPDNSNEGDHVDTSINTTNLDTLILESGDVCMVGVKLDTASPLNLIASAHKTALGVVLIAVRSIALEIAQQLPKNPSKPILKTQP